MSGRLSIDVIVAAWNAENTISQAVGSALNQPEVKKVIVVDDASTDLTAQVAAAAGQGSDRIEILRLEANQGPSAARNRALDISQADAICVLDADDFMQPGRLARMSSAFDECDLLADDMLYMAPPDQTIKSRNLFGLSPGETRDLTLEAFLAGSISHPSRPRGELGFMKPLMSRAFIEARRLRYRENMRLGEDYAFYAEALRLGARFRLMPACGYVAVERSTSLSALHKTSDLAEYLAFDDELLRQDLAPEVRAILKKHRFNTASRLAHRAFLDAKKRRNYAELLRILLASPPIGASVARAIMRDKLGI